MSTDPLFAVETAFGVTRLTMVGPHLLVAAQVPFADPARAKPHGIGQFGVLVDMTAGRTVRAYLPASHTVRTANLRLDAGDRAPTPGGRVQARGRLLHLDDRHAVSGVELTDSVGRVVARAVARFVVVEVGPGPVTNPVTDADTATDADGLQEGPPSGAGPVRADDAFGPLRFEPGERTAELVVEPKRWWANQDGVVHGGAQIALADVALRRGTERLTGERTEVLDLTVRFLRAVPVDGRPLQLRVAIEKSGRVLTVARTSCRDVDSRLLMTAEATLASAVLTRPDGAGPAAA